MGGSLDHLTPIPGHSLSPAAQPREEERCTWDPIWERRQRPPRARHPVRSRAPAAGCPHPLPSLSASWGEGTGQGPASELSLPRVIIFHLFTRLLGPGGGQRLLSVGFHTRLELAARTRLCSSHCEAMGAEASPDHRAWGRSLRARPQTPPPAEGGSLLRSLCGLLTRWL